MKLSPLEKRAKRRERSKSMVDLNLVSLIDIFIILIFFLMFNASGVEILPNNKAVKLPESTASVSPKESLVVLVSGQEIQLQGRRVASVAEVLANNQDVIEPLRAELEALGGVSPPPEPGKSSSGRSITIMGDKDIPYRLLRKVMATCARANFEQISFAVLRKNKT